MLSQDITVNGARQGFGDQPKDGAGRRPWFQVALHVRTAGVELSRDWMQVIATFGNGERDDTRAGLRHLLDDQIRILRRQQILQD
jgi:hypothetical protein